MKKRLSAYNIIWLILLLISCSLFKDGASRTSFNGNINDTSKLTINLGIYSGMRYAIIDYYVFRKKKYTYRLAFSFPISDRLNFLLEKTVYDGRKYLYTFIATDKQSVLLPDKTLYAFTEEDKRILLFAIDKLGAYNVNNRFSEEAIKSITYWIK